MNTSANSFQLQAPEAFKFPYQAYDIQKNFMKSLFETCEKGQLGIFESPTGTGKSMSLLCGALEWLLEHEKREICQLETETGILKMSLDDGCDNWLDSQAEILKKRVAGDIARKRLEFLKSRSKRISAFQNELMKLKADQKLDRLGVKGNPTLPSAKSTEETPHTDLDPSMIEFILPDVDESEELVEETETTEEEKPATKIFVCSRTHSQLAQLFGEFKKSPFGKLARIVILGSRQNYCINNEVLAEGNIALVNERCMELHQKKAPRPPTGKPSKRAKRNECPYYENTLGRKMLSLTSMTEPLNVEDLVKRGKEMQACPFYSSRASVKDAQIVLLPYQLLLHSEARASSGIDLSGSVVIIDEAHNLLDTISNMHSCVLSQAQIQRVCVMLQAYENRYKKLLSAANLLNVRQLIFIAKQLNLILSCQIGKETTSSAVMLLPEFLSAASIDNYNISNLIKFCEKSRLANKLQGFSRLSECTVTVSQPLSGIRGFLNNSKPAPVTPPSPQPEKKEACSGPILSFIEFLRQMMQDRKNGRVVINKHHFPSTCYLKFLLLNPADKFTDIVKNARAVIVAGGTMQPLSEFRDQLFTCAGGEAERIQVFSCGHIVSSNNILPLVISKGPTNISLRLTMANRIQSSVMSEVGRCIVNLCNVVPSGMVVFFPSYQYMNNIIEHWENDGNMNSMSKKKQVFQEPKLANEVEQLLKKYSSQIESSSSANTSTNGAVLFSVVGGKMSEGINFNDDLCRCVVVVGMPYANAYSHELVAKMKYLSSNFPCNLSSDTRKEIEEANKHLTIRDLMAVNGVSAGNRYYDDLCMKAVNQSIGRAIRHKDDYAAMVLLDERYMTSQIQAGLPNWVQPKVTIPTSFGNAIFRLRQFFSSMKSPSCV